METEKRERPSEDIVEPPKDAVIHITTEDKGLTAYLFIEAPLHGGAAPTISSLSAALSASQVTYQLDLALLKSISAQPVYGEKLLIARGTAPVDGVDGTATFHIKEEQTELRPKTDEKGVVDYRDLGLVENVTAGQLLCSITPPTEGTPGMTVHGKEIPQRRGRPVPSYLGRNTQFSEDGSQITAQIDGHVEFNGSKINVDRTLYIKENVDNATGNLRVSGDLTIAGMVMPGFLVEASGNIEIRGAVENATVKAEGNLTIHSGVFSSELSCGGDFRCQFIENSTVFATGEAQAQSIVHSNVKCGKSLRVQGKMAKIIGGSCMAGQNIEADTIGTPSNVRTRIELGTDPAVINRQQELVEEIAILEMKLEKLAPLLGILRQLEAANRLTEDKRKVLEDASFTHGTDSEALVKAKAELEEIVQAISEKGFGQILCRTAIFPGTTVTIGRASLTVTATLQNTRLYHQDGDVCIGTAR